MIPGTGRSPGEGIGYPLQYSWTSLVAQMVKNPPPIWETWVQSLGWEDPLEKGMATHSSILAWRIPIDRAWQAAVHGVAKSQKQLSTVQYRLCYLSRSFLITQYYLIHKLNLNHLFTSYSFTFFDNCFIEVKSIHVSAKILSILGTFLQMHFNALCVFFKQLYFYKQHPQ